MQTNDAPVSINLSEDIRIDFFVSLPASLIFSNAFARMSEHIWAPSLDDCSCEAKIDGVAIKELKKSVGFFSGSVSVSLCSSSSGFAPIRKGLSLLMEVPDNAYALFVNTRWFLHFGRAHFCRTVVPVLGMPM